jgi:hypothetical protein
VPRTDLLSCCQSAWVGADAAVAVAEGVPVVLAVVLAEVGGVGGEESSAEQAASPPSAPATRARLLIA